MDIDGKRDDTTVITRTENEDPEARLRRRERREALKQAAQGEEDESLLDESDTEEAQEDLPAAGGLSATSAGLAPPPDHTEPTAPTAVQPPLPATADPAAATTEDDRATGKEKINKKKLL